VAELEQLGEVLVLEQQPLGLGLYVQQVRVQQQVQELP
jgi:hypothetical protein